MKSIKKIMIIGFVLFCTYQMMAQVAIGAKVGANYSTWQATDEAQEFGDKKYSTGVLFGGIFNIGITENFSVQPELQFIQKGVKMESTETVGGTKITSKLGVSVNYLEVPIMAKYAFGDPEKVQFFVTGGPSIGYGLNGKLKSEFKAGEDGQKEETKINFKDDNFNRTDFGAAFGAGLGLPLGASSLNLDLRYLLGFSNLNTDADTKSKEKAHNRGFGASVGFLYPLGK